MHDLLHGPGPMREYCDDSEAGGDCWTISVTGHSLGGGIATVVGATLNISVGDLALLF